MTERKEQNEEIYSDAKAYLRKLKKSLRFQSSAEVVDLNMLASNLPDETKRKVSIEIGHEFLYISRRDIKDPRYPGVNVQIGRMQLGDECNFLSFIADSDELLVKDTFRILGNIDIFREAKTRFRIDAADEEELARAEQKAARMNAESEKKEREMDEIRTLSIQESLKHKRDSVDVEDDGAVMRVNQGELGILDEKDRRQYIESIGAGPCIIVVAQNPKTKTIGLTHMDGLTNIEATLNELIHATNGSEISILGGDESSIQNLVALKKYFDSKGIRPVLWDILKPKPTSIVVDKKTGKIFDVSNPKDRKGGSKPSIESLMFQSLKGRKRAKRIY